MRPVLFEIPLFNGIPVHAYGFCIMLGFIVGSWVAAKRGPRVGVPSEFVLDLSLYVMIAGILGSRIFYVIQYRHDPQYNWAAFDLGDGGFSFVGGVFGWLLPICWFMLYRIDPKKSPPWLGRVLDHIIPAASVALRKEYEKPPVRSLFSKLIRLVIWCFIVGLVAGRAGYLIDHRHDPRFINSFEFLKIWHGGIVFYGGLICAVLVAFWYIKRCGQSILVVSDLFLPEVALGYAFARIGCFLNGCCFGHPTRVAWAVRYPAGSPAWDDQVRDGLIPRTAHESLAVHPSQLYACVISVVIFFILTAIWKRNKIAGVVMCWYGILYSIYRFLIEITRGDERREWPGWLPPHLQMTISQWISVWMFLASIVLLVIVTSRARRTPEPAQHTTGALR